MKAYIKMASVYELEKETLRNKYYRYVVHTTPTMQLVMMTLKRGEEIPLEVHPHTTQFIRIEKGTCRLTIGKNEYILEEGDAAVVPPNTTHRVQNEGKSMLKLYTIYSPPEHSPNRVDVNMPLKN